MKKIIGIYCIENLINHKKYIGLSKDCLKRWADHYSKSINSKRIDDVNKPLYRAMKKYGRENFSFSILEECKEDELKEKEIFWIHKLNTYYKGYNATLGRDLPEGHILKGEDHGRSKLTEKEVIFCREQYKNGKESRKIWEQYFSSKITYQGFQKMWHGKTWKHVMPEVFEHNPRPRKKFTDEEIRKVKELYSKGYSCAEIYSYFEKRISRTTINDICNKRRYVKIN